MCITANSWIGPAHQQCVFHSYSTLHYQYSLAVPSTALIVPTRASPATPDPFTLGMKLMPGNATPSGLLYDTCSKPWTVGKNRLI